MTSNLQIQRICEYCGKEFTAKTTVTRCCSDTCSKKAYKARLRAVKVEISNKETLNIKVKPIEDIKMKEVLNVPEVAILLGCSKRSAYRLIDNGTLTAVNLGERLTRVKRSELNKILEQAIQVKTKIVKYDISECYNLKEVQEKYSISESALQALIIRNNIPKIRSGKYAFVPKIIIDSLLS